METNERRRRGACEDCGARLEHLGTFGTHGRQQTWHTTVSPAPVMLGHDGYLCCACWWARVARERVAA